jgi:hypothetical protein
VLSFGRQINRRIKKMWISKKKYKAELEKAERRGAEKYYPYYKACKRLERYIEAEQKRENMVKSMEARNDA